jgi:hypothetical protein
MKSPSVFLIVALGLIWFFYTSKTTHENNRNLEKKSADKRQTKIKSSSEALTRSFHNTAGGNITQKKVPPVDATPENGSYKSKPSLQKDVNVDRETAPNKVIEAMEELEIIEQEWMEFRDELYEELNLTSQQREQIIEARGQYASLFEETLELTNSHSSSIQKKAIKYMYDLAYLFDMDMKNLLGAHSFKIMTNARDRFNESVAQDPSLKYVMGIGSHW